MAKEIGPKVRLMTKFDPTVITNLYEAYRQCYSAETAASGTIKLPSLDEQIAFIKSHRNHATILGMASFMFAVEGMSRSCSHQWVRTRIAAHAQQSQRYCGLDKFEEFTYIVPPLLTKPGNEGAFRLYTKHMQASEDVYQDIARILHNNPDNTKEDLKEIAGSTRYVLPAAASTAIVTSYNMQSLIHFLGMRCCSHAQWEIRDIANKLLQLLNDEWHGLFEGVGSNCVYNGHCPEGKECHQYKQIILPTF